MVGPQWGTLNGMLTLDIGPNLFTLSGSSGNVTWHVLPPITQPASPIQREWENIQVFEPGMTPGELLMDPTGEYLYAISSRNPGGEVIRRLAMQTGALNLNATIATNVTGLKDAILAGSSGQWLILAGQEGGQIAVFDAAADYSNVSGVSRPSGWNSIPGMPTSLLLVGLGQ